MGQAVEDGRISLFSFPSNYCRLRRTLCDMSVVGTFGMFCAFGNESVEAAKEDPKLEERESGLPLLYCAQPTNGENRV